MYVCILYISTVVCHDMFLAAGNMMLCLRHHIAHSPLCTSCSLFKIKTKADSYMPCEAMAHSTKYILALAAFSHPPDRAQNPRNCQFGPCPVSKFLLCHSHRPFVSKCQTGPMCHSHRGVSN